MTTTKRRIEIRSDEREQERLTAAAALRGVSTSAFLLQAGLREADQILGPAEVMVLPAEQFDRLLTALDEPATAPVALVATAAKERRFTRG